jgi:hypothetical protein
MDRNQIDRFRSELRAELERLDSQRAGIMATLDGLSQMEATFFGGVLPGRSSLKREAKTDPTPKTASGEQQGLTARSRMLNALAKLPEIFHRQDLFDAASSDGNGSINKNTLAGLFSDFVRNGVVKVLGEKTGNKPARYCRGEDYLRLTTKSDDPGFSGFDLFGEGAGPKR